MAYHNSVYLFFFLPVVLVCYQLMPRRKRWLVLLLFSYAFFFLISKWLIGYLLGASLVTWGFGLLIGQKKRQGKEAASGMERAEAKTVKQQYRKKEKRILVFGILLLLSVLLYLKYYNFFAKNINLLLVKGGSSRTLPAKKLLLPIGISFYTLQAIGYLADVYWGKLEAQRHFGKVALFLSFFPQVMEGPISLYSQTAEALYEGAPLTLENLSRGCIRIAWGLFKKLIIADRLYVAVEVLFGEYQNYHGAMIVFAAVAYTVQLYMEFSGCIDIIIGSGRLFGVTVPENFRQPFFSKSAAEFWRRWHITLGIWFKTYIFYPISVSSLVRNWNRFGKERLNKYLTKLGVTVIALFPVWLCNGLWHGARWSYLFYGMYYFVILVAEVAVEPVRERILSVCRIREEAGWFCALRVLKTWVIIFAGELFFRAESLSDGFRMFGRIFSHGTQQGFGLSALWDGTLLSLGLDRADYLVVAGGCVIVAVAEGIKEKDLLGEAGIFGLRLPIRWAVILALILSVWVFGAYGIGYQQVDMIYAGF